MWAKKAKTVLIVSNVFKENEQNMEAAGCVSDGSFEGRQKNFSVGSCFGVSAFNEEQRVSGVVKRVCGVLGDLTLPHETIVNVLMISGKIFLDIFVGESETIGLNENGRI